MAKSFGSKPAPMSIAGAGIQSLPDLAPKPYFELYVHPRQWTFTETSPGTFEWLPDLTKIAYRAGVNACIYESVVLADGTKRKVIKNLDEVRMLTAKRGYQLVDRDGPAGDYLMTMDTQSGEHYHAAWETYEHAEGFGVQRILDQSVKVEFQRELVAHAVVAKPPEVFRTRAIQSAADQVQRWASAPKSDAQAAGQAKAEQRLKAMEATPLPTPGATPEPAGDDDSKDDKKSAPKGKASK